MNLSVMTPDGAFNWLLIIVGALIAFSIVLFYIAGFF